MPQFARSADGGSTFEILGFYLHFHGVKSESPNQTVKIEQSQTDRSKIPYTPVRVDPVVGSEAKFTVCRLHFSETTSNNMRKKGRPNPDQRFFQLVVSLVARCHDITGKIDALSHGVASSAVRQTPHDVVESVVAAQISEPIIVRASNPGQFDNEPEAPWSKGTSSDCVYHMGTVGINTETADEALTVHGNVRVTGHVLSPSDTRIKTDVEEVDTREQLNNIARLRLVKFAYRDQYADSVGLSENQRKDTGVLAQEVEHILPDAVIETGDIVLENGETIPNLMVVNKERIFIENVGAVKELCKVTDNLESRINLIESLNKKVASMQRTNSGRSMISTSSKATYKLRSEKADSTVDQQRNEKSQHRADQHDPSTNCAVPNDLNSISAVDVTSDKPGGLCNSRLVQVVIVLLVAIMAACLVAITVIVVLDSENTQALQPQFETSGNSTQDTMSTVTPNPAAVQVLHALPNPALVPECSTKCCMIALVTRSDVTNDTSEPVPSASTYNSDDLIRESAGDHNITICIKVHNGSVNCLLINDVINYRCIPMNQSNVAVRFILPDASLRVRLCSQRVKTPCWYENSTGAATNGQTMNDLSSASRFSSSPLEWHLPVGFYATSSYSFIVSKQDFQCDSVETEPATSASTAYNIDFYRTCTT